MTWSIRKKFCYSNWDFDTNSTLQTSSQKLQKRFERGFLLFENCFIHFANSQFQLIYSVTTNNSFSHSRQRKWKGFLYSNKKELFKLVGKDWGGWVTLLLYFTSLKLRRLFSFFFNFREVRFFFVILSIFFLDVKNGSLRWWRIPEVFCLLMERGRRSEVIFP